VGQSVVHYAKENGIDLVALGARGMGSWKRAMMSFVGLGSVSDYVVAHVEAPVIVVKQH
jgi:nucleotide-binding universal stress UspA family protein